MSTVRGYLSISAMISTCKDMLGLASVNAYQTKSAATINITSKERSNNGAGATQTTFSQDRIDFQETRFRWVGDDIPAFKPEPFITTYRDYISKINFELAYTSYPNQPIKTYMGSLSWADINKQDAESADFGERS
ncbi:MAG: hypothetical protein U5K54_17145 [Cytophagales bacterium]|nr:hypothetical protein [Cytophagales bacterium]